MRDYKSHYPFGMQMPGSSPQMNQTGSPDTRYKYISVDQDPETSRYYFGARYYNAWSGRWLSVDPLAKKYPGWSPYNYTSDNPVLLIDANGEGNNNSNQPPEQQTLKLVGPEEYNPASISANGFRQPSVSPLSQLLSSFSNALENVSQATALASASFLVGGAVTGTEEFTAPVAGGLALTSYLAEVGSFGFKVINYAEFNRGSSRELYGQGIQLAFEGAFTVVAKEAAKGLTLTGEQETGKESLDFALGAIFMAGTINPNAGAHEMGTQYSYPDATSSTLGNSIGGR